MKLINSITKQEVKIGDTVISFRGEKYEVRSWSEPHHAGSTGRMYVKSDQYDREQIIARSIEHLKKELQTIDDENDLSYDELKSIIKGFGFWTHST